MISKYQSVFHRVDETVLTLLSKRNPDVDAIIYTAIISKQFKLDIKRYNAQYPKIEIKQLPYAIHTYCRNTAYSIYEHHKIIR